MVSTIGTLIEQARNIHDHAYEPTLNGRPQFTRYAQSRRRVVERARANLRGHRWTAGRAGSDTALGVEYVAELRDPKDWY